MFFLRSPTKFLEFNLFQTVPIWQSQETHHRQEKFKLRKGRCAWVKTAAPFCLQPKHLLIGLGFPSFQALGCMQTTIAQRCCICLPSCLFMHRVTHPDPTRCQLPTALEEQTRSVPAWQPPWSILPVVRSVSINLATEFQTFSCLIHVIFQEDKFGNACRSTLPLRTQKEI